VSAPSRAGAGEVNDVSQARDALVQFERDGAGRKMYEEGLVDFFAIYLIPIDTWYIIPFAAIGRTRCSLHFTPGSKRKTYERYREAWELMKPGS
jgi:hypothetical protein